MPWADRRGDGSVLLVVSTWSSTSSGRAPSMRGHHDRARDAEAPVGQEHAAGVGHALEALLRHLEQAELLGGPEAVLHHPQQAQGVVAVALERQDGVDHVLEHAGPGQRAVLGDVAHQHDGAAAALGLLHQAVACTRAPGPPSPAWRPGPG